MPVTRAQKRRSVYARRVPTSSSSSSQPPTQQSPPDPLHVRALGVAAEWYVRNERTEAQNQELRNQLFTATNLNQHHHQQIQQQQFMLNRQRQQLQNQQQQLQASQEPQLSALRELVQERENQLAQARTRTAQAGLRSRVLESQLSDQRRRFDTTVLNLRREMEELETYAEEQDESWREQRQLVLQLRRENRELKNQIDEFTSIFQSNDTIMDETE